MHGLVCRSFAMIHPSTVADVRPMFQRNDCFTRQELFPGTFEPTPTHYFMRLLHDKGLLLRCYTQNIDSLEHLAGLPKDAIVAAHGNFDGTNELLAHASVKRGGYPNESFLARCFWRWEEYCHLLGLRTPNRSLAAAHCIGKRCGKEFSTEYVRKAVMKDELCKCDKCGALVKPDIVFFGEALPQRFFHLSQEDLPAADLLLVMGTSLVVQPFASLIGEHRHVPQRAMRWNLDFNPIVVLVMRRRPCRLCGRRHAPAAHQQGARGRGQRRAQPPRAGRGFVFNGDGCYRDILVQGDCDEGTRQLCGLLGWRDELEALVSESKAASDPAHAKPRI